MTSFDLHFKKQSQPYFSNCLSPKLGPSSQEQSESCFGNPTNLNAVTIRNMNSGRENANASPLFGDALEFLKPPSRSHQQGQQFQQTREKTKELDALLAKSMAELSFQERQEHQEVLHGVASATQEDEAQIEKWLQELDDRLQDRTSKSNWDSKISAYVYANQTNPEHVKNRMLRLMFLRGNQYHPESAADQLIRFFATKEGLFGRDKLCKDITLNDMDEDDKKAILSGALQILGQDQAGRQIMLEFTSLRKEIPSLQSELRAKYYIFLNVLMNNPQAQIKGIVLIIYGVEQFQDQSGGKGFVENTSMALSLPLQFAGFHLCISDLKQYVVCAGALKVAPTKWRARFKVHFGSHLECQYLLSTYGISIENLPLIPDTNEARMDYHWQWYRECFMKECNNSSSSSSNNNKNANAEYSSDLPKFLWNLPYIPRRNDVLFHRRKCNNGGNLRLRALTRNLLQAYNNGNKHVKRELVDYMITDIANTGGRFLKQEEGKRHQHDEQQSDNDSSDGWKLVEEPEIREKISQMFRNHRRPNVQQQQQQHQQELQQHEEFQHEQIQEPDMLSITATTTTATTITETLQQNLLESSMAISAAAAAAAAAAATNEATTTTRAELLLRPPSPQPLPTSVPSVPPVIPQIGVAPPTGGLLLLHNDADVLFGRRRNNGGNKLVRKMVAELAPEYESANRARKLEITNTIVEQVQAFGGRFLRKTTTTTTTTMDDDDDGDDEQWEEVGNDYARAKISKHFRNHRRPQKLKQPS